jgi:hypothetical protein
MTFVGAKGNPYKPAVVVRVNDVGDFEFVTNME